MIARRRPYSILAHVRDVLTDKHNSHDVAQTTAKVLSRKAVSIAAWTRRCSGLAQQYLDEA